MKYKELLEEAKRKFPIGTIYDNSNLISTGGRRKITGIPYNDHFNNAIKVKEGELGRWLYKDGKWAEIAGPEEPNYEIY